MIKLFKALGDENRLRITNLLMHGELCVCELEVILEMTQSNVSRHLSKLKSANIISSSKEAQWVHYKVSDEFKDKDVLLFNYIKESFEINELFSNDIKRYARYKAHKLNCRCINDDKEKVLNILEKEDLK